MYAERLTAAAEAEVEAIVEEQTLPLRDEIVGLQADLLQAQTAAADEAEVKAALVAQIADLQVQIATLQARVSELEAEATHDPGVLPYWGTPAWRDEFDYRDANGNPAVDPAKWYKRSRADLGLLNDVAIPDAGQITVDAAGICHIRADWLATPVARGGTGPTPLTHMTGYMDHRAYPAGKPAIYEQTYGRWEARLKAPTGPNTLGALPAFWLRSAKSGEIDIFESWGFGSAPKSNGQKDGTSTTTVHTQTSGSGNVKYAWTLEEELKKKDGVQRPKVYDGFVTVALEFTPDYFAVFYDGVEAFRATPATKPNLWNPSYFGSPLHVRLNLHVGPSVDYYGLPDPARRELTKPLDFQIDYVRIWKMPA